MASIIESTCYNTTLKQLTGNDVNYDQQLIDKFDIFLNCFLLHFLSLLGVIANILNILVLSRHTFKETTTILLLSLSINDLICSLTQPFRRLQCFFEQFDPLMALTVRSISVVYLYAIPDVFVSISICHTTAIAIERVVAVCFPFQVSRTFTPYRVKWMIAFLYVYPIALLSPMFKILDLVWVYDPQFNATRGGFVYSKFLSENYDILNQFSTIGITNLLSTAPLVVILLCSLVIVVKLLFSRHNYLKRISGGATNLVKDGRVAKMLLTVCVVTFVASLPTVVINVYILYTDLSLMKNGKFFYVLRSVIACLYQFNAAINFIIYVTMSSKFFRTYVNLFRCGLRHDTKSTAAITRSAHPGSVRHDICLDRQSSLKYSLHNFDRK